MILAISLSVTPATRPTHLDPHYRLFTIRNTCHTPHSLSFPIHAFSMYVTLATRPNLSVLTISLSVKPATRPTHSVPHILTISLRSQLTHTPLAQFPHSHDFTIRHPYHTPHSLNTPSPFSEFHCASHLPQAPITQFHPFLTISLPSHLPQAPFTQFHPFLKISLPSQLTQAPLTLFRQSQHFTVRHTCHTLHSLNSPSPFSPFHCPSNSTSPTHSVHPISHHFNVRHTCHTPHSLSSPIINFSLSFTPATHPTHSVHTF